MTFLHFVYCFHQIIEHQYNVIQFLLNLDILFVQGQIWTFCLTFETEFMLALTMQSSISQDAAIGMTFTLG